MKRFLGCVVLVLLSTMAVSAQTPEKKSNDVSQAAAPAQAKETATTAYKLDFIVSEMEDGKAINSRNFTALNLGSEPVSIRTGNRVPLYQGDSKQFNYYETGINIDALVRGAVGNLLWLRVTCDVSAVAPQKEPEPITRQFRWNGHVGVPLGKRTVIFTSDDVGSKRTMQVELIATKIS